MANDRTLVQIRERSYLDLLDLVLLVVRQRPRALGLAAAAGIAPFAAVNYGDPLQPRNSTGDLAGAVVPGSALGYGPADPGARRTDVRPAAPGRHDPRADDQRVAIANLFIYGNSLNHRHDRAFHTPDSRPVLVLEGGDPAQ